MKERTNSDKRMLTTFLALFGFGLLLGCGLLAPIVIGKLFGHSYGVAMSAINAVAYLILGLKIVMAPSTRLLWLGGFCFIGLVAFLEYSRI